MTAGANLEINNGRILFWKSLVIGDKLITQDHEARMSAKQGTYIPYPQYGNPFVRTMVSEISAIERNMRLVSETKECALQDRRLVDAIVDTFSIVEDGSVVDFKYDLIKASGGVLERKEEEEEPDIPEIDLPFYNFITEDGDNFITEDGDNFITETI